MSLRFRSIDALRGLAAVAVIFHHTPLYAYGTHGSAGWGNSIVELYKLGWWGVPAFFAISGYCVLAAAERSPNVWIYFRRRFWRIYPPYFAAIIVTLALWLILGNSFRAAPNRFADPRDVGAWGWLGNLTLTGIWLPRLTQRPSPFILGPAWTLCYEEGYYIAVGLLLALGRWFSAGIIVFTLCAYALYQADIDCYGTPADPYWFAFAAGAAAYLCASRTRNGVRWFCFACLALFAAYLLAQAGSALLLAEHSTAPAGGAGGAAIAVFLLAIRPYDRWISSRRGFWPLQWCGDRCYSIYLVHWPICKAVAISLHRFGLDDYQVFWPVATLTLTLSAGHLFYLAVEHPLRRVHKNPPA